MSNPPGTTYYRWEAVGMRVVLIAGVIAALAAGGCARSPAQRPISMQELMVTGTDFRFDPASLELQEGTPVRLTFRNAGAVPHDLQILELPAEVRGKSQQHTEHGKTGADGAVHVGTNSTGQTATIEFTPSRTGTFTVICTLPGHAEAGMKGTVQVR